MAIAAPSLPGSNASGPAIKGIQTLHTPSTDLRKRQITNRDDVINVDQGRAFLLVLCHGKAIGLQSAQENYMRQLATKGNPPKKFQGLSYQFLQKQKLPQWAKVDANYDDNDVTITVDTDQGARFAANSSNGNYVTIENTRTGEVMLVTSVSGDVLTVTRAQQGTSGVAGLTTDYLQIIGGQHGEDSKSPDTIANQPWYVTRSMQRFRRSLKMTTAEQAELKNDNFEAKGELKRKISEIITALIEEGERAYMWNLQSAAASSSTSGGTTIGLRGSITSNVFDAAGVALTQDNLDQCIISVTRNTPEKPVVIASESLMATLNGFGADLLRIDQKDKSDFYGRDVYNYMAWVAPGAVPFYQHPFLSANYDPINVYDDSPVSNVGWSGTSFVCTMSDIQPVEYTGMEGIIETPLLYEDGRTVTGTDYSFVGSMYLGDEKRHCMIENMIGYA